MASGHQDPGEQRPVEGDQDQGEHGRAEAGREAAPAEPGRLEVLGGPGDPVQLPAPSIIIEWETGLECAGGRVHACLGALAGQLAELGPRFAAPAQTIISHHPAQVPEAVIREAVARAAGVWPGILRIVASPGPRPLHYYQKKNFGFGFATGDVVIFLDSDVNPEPGWLRSLLEPFNDYRKAVVVGHTHLVARTFYERAMALCWIFDTRIQEDRVEPHHRLLSNNNAFRRAVFARFPFQDLPTYRVSCGELSKSLRRARNSCLSR